MRGRAAWRLVLAMISHTIAAPPATVVTIDGTTSTDASGSAAEIVAIASKTASIGCDASATSIARDRQLNTASNQAVLHLRDISQLSPPALEVMRLPSLSMTIVPEWSVRMVRAPARPSDARTSALGWP